MVDRAGLRDHQRRPAEDAAPVVLAQPMVRGTVYAPHTLHAGHHEPALQMHLPDVERLQQRREVIACGTDRPVLTLRHSVPFRPRGYSPTSIIAADRSAA